MITGVKNIVFNLTEAIENIGKTKNNKYLLLGPDFVSKKLFLERIEKTFLDSSGKSFDRVVVWGDEKNAFDKIVEALWSIPVFSEYKIIIVHKTDQLKDNKYFSEQEQKKIPGTSIVVFLSDLGEGKRYLSSRKCPSVIRDISSFSEVCIFLDPYPNERKSFIGELEKIYDVNIEPQNKEIICAQGPQTAVELHRIFGIIKDELLKGTGLEIKDLFTETGTLENLAFSVGGRDLGYAIICLEDATRWGIKTNEIVRTLSLYFDTIRAIRYYMDQKCLPSDSYSLQKLLLKDYRIYVSPENAPKYIIGAKNWKEKEISKVREILFHKNLDIRTGGSDLFLSLSSLIGDIINTKK
ncbi:hypothetical protein JXA84_09540 [candidate division WOR-3 bacterium]|nr:hypothetical protein [candidate division WOR-3 bacterium]